MSIGDALAAARNRAGLTVTQVSQRTRIRETIIRDIERGDYGSCGGDFYARGHIRAIAKTVGLDPAPLIEEYDAAASPPEPPHTEKPQTHRPNLRLDRRSTDADSAASASGGTPRTKGISATEAFRPAMPLRIGGQPRHNWTFLLAAVLLASVAFLSYHLATSGNTSGRSTASDRGKPSAHPTPAVSRSITSSASGTGPLVPASAAAFGPDGVGQGDNPGLASLAIDGSASDGWQTDWYATATFAGLESGTGLLLDMGKPVTVTSAQMTLAAYPGASVQIRVGNTPELADLQPVAQATDASGTLSLQPANPTTARYVLIWFTRLPPDSAGTYQETVSDIKLIGSS